MKPLWQKGNSSSSIRALEHYLGEEQKRLVTCYSILLASFRRMLHGGWMRTIEKQTRQKNIGIPVATSDDYSVGRAVFFMMVGAGLGYILFVW